MRFVYPVVIRRTERGYHAAFPDLALCEADGETIDECIRNCNLEAYEWLDLEMHEEDPEIPAATDLDELEAQYAADADVTVRNILTIYRMREGWDE